MNSHKFRKFFNKKKPSMQNNDVHETRHFAFHKNQQNQKHLMLDLAEDDKTSHMSSPSSFKVFTRGDSVSSSSSYNNKVLYSEKALSKQCNTYDDTDEKSPAFIR